ncbi:GNAT family N-acetyltransferase [Oceanirhabdus sp. W0125-5]|uniref:GNAT family N-acetyltransferase n=1 Tax=Oceanirhabdus sp. W0125-5 TaxID=2999116 RepID=UPI0022F3436D|nr:GNAT family N-acetyltransferase [Oceanirhabdus sp. W0125-5]WBW94856.1 GNAT family N-acetyltransferase [Oceanirhabdus sp. W0125-5]
MNIKYNQGDKDLLNQIKPLWEKLNEHHIEKSEHFKERFRSFTFDSRICKLVENDNRKINIIIASDGDQNIGYCLASVLEPYGEIESLYINPMYRGLNIGEKLMNDSLQWINSHEVDDIMIGVAGGNEEAFGFYEKFGFYQRVTKLGLKKE